MITTAIRANLPMLFNDQIRLTAPTSKDTPHGPQHRNHRPMAGPNRLGSGTPRIHRNHLAWRDQGAGVSGRDYLNDRRSEMVAAEYRSRAFGVGNGRGGGFAVAHGLAEALADFGGKAGIGTEAQRSFNS